VRFRKPPVSSASYRPFFWLSEPVAHPRGQQQCLPAGCVSTTACLFLLPFLRRLPSLEPRVGSLFRAHEICVEVDSSRGVFCPFPGLELKQLSKSVLDLKFLPSVRRSTQITKPNCRFGSALYPAVDHALKA